MKKAKAHVKNAPKARAVLALEEFAGQYLELRDDSLFCGVCRTFVKFSEVRYVRSHCFGSQLSTAKASFEASDEETKTGLSHYKKAAARRALEADAKVLADSVKLQQQAVWKQETEAERKRRRLPSTLEADMLARRVHVLRLHYRMGIPLSKLDDPEYLAEWQAGGLSLGGRDGVLRVRDVLSKHILEELGNTLSAAHGGLVACTHDGSKVGHASASFSCGC
jgi:hypothetical protein